MSHALITELYTHQAWADAELIRAVGDHPDVRSDAGLIGLIHHVVAVQRVFSAMLRSTPFDMEKDCEPVESLSALRDLSVSTHADLLQFVNAMSVESLDAAVHNPRMPDLRSTNGETLMQIVLHSQNHRGQCLMRLRELTGKAPTLDFILWVKLGRPCPTGAAQSRNMAAE